MLPSFVSTNYFKIFLSATGFAALGMIVLPDLVLMGTLLLVLGTLWVISPWARNSNENKRGSLAMTLGFVVCSLGYVLLTNENTLQLEPDGSPRIHSARWRMVLTPSRFYSGQLKLVTNEISELVESYVPPDVYAAQLVKKAQGIEADLKSIPGVRATLQEADQRGSSAERYASALERKAQNTRSQESYVNAALVHDKKVREHLVELQQLKAIIDAKLLAG